MNSQNNSKTNRTLVLAAVATLAVLGIIFFSTGSSVQAGSTTDPFTPPVFDTALTHDGGQPCGIVFASSPMIADLNGDGKQEIIVGTEKTNDWAACLAVVNFDGTPRWTRMLPGSADSTAAVADLNGDGNLEIVIGFGSGTTEGGVAAYDRDGNRLWLYQTDDRNGDGKKDAFWASPAVVDVNGDGTKQVAITGWDMRVHLINGATGTTFAAPANNRWPAEMLDSIWSSPAIADIDGNGKADIVFGGDISANSAAGTQNGGLLRVMHNEPGVGPAHTTGFNVQYGNLTGAPLNIGHYGLYVDQALYSSPVVADFGARGKLIIIGSGCAFPAGTNCNGTGNGKWVKVWGANGQLVATLTTDAEVFSSPIVADVNGDGVLDIIATTMANNSTVGGSVYVWSGQPGFPLLWSAKVKNFFGSQSFVIPASPVAADINGDGGVEIVFGYLTEIVVFDKTGKQLTETTGAIRTGIPTLWVGRSPAYNSAAVADLAGNGTVQIVAAGSFCLSTCDNQGHVRAWNGTLFAAGTNPLVQSAGAGVRSASWPAAGMAWPMFRHDTAHAAYEPGAPVVPQIDLPNKVYLPVIRK